MPEFQVYLASSSPRRGELLAQIGVIHERLPVDVDETARSGESARRFVERLAREKAEAGLDRRPAGDARPVIGSDTALELDGEILGKPRDRADFEAMFSRLSGRSHRVFTGVTVADGRHAEVRVNETRVGFRPVAIHEMRAYWASGGPEDKAGGYAIQGRGAVFVADIRGSYSGVMGLPLFETAALLERFGIKVL